MHLVNKTNSTNKYRLAILIKESAFDIGNLRKHYINKLIVPDDDIICFGLKYSKDNKAPVKLIKEYLNDLMPDITTVNSNILLVADTAYFKVLTGNRKISFCHGIKYPCSLKNYEHIDIILISNYQALFYNPEIASSIDMSLRALEDVYTGTYSERGTNVLHNPKYPDTASEIALTLQELHKYSELSCDIEAFSLQFWKAGIGTIAFAHNEHEGIAFCCDYLDARCALTSSITELYGRYVPNKQIRNLLKEFFITYKGKLTYHNGTYDIKVIIYVLFMEHSRDFKGLLYGLDIMCNNIDDTKLIAYLATNTTAGNNLKLKHLAFEHCGNYGQDNIDDIRLIPKDELLEYNLTDAVATNFVKNKYKPIMIKDNQAKLYKEAFLAGTRMIIHTELIGMPIKMRKVRNLRGKLESEIRRNTNIVNASKTVQKYEWTMQRLEMIKCNLLLKQKIRPIEDFYKQFNPGSGTQVAGLLYTQLQYPILKTTKTGLPATGTKVLQTHLDYLINKYNITEEELK